jgi:RimJ/RimL family protein N-acetyltransferase
MAGGSFSFRTHPPQLASLLVTKEDAMHNPFLIGETIYLRPLEKADAPLGARWLNDPEVNRTLSRYRPMTLPEEEEFIDGPARCETDMVLGVVLRSDDRLIGITGLHKIDWRCRHTCFGILIGEKQEQGKGRGTQTTQLMVRYAFETLNLNRVWLEVYENNPRGRHVYEKVGFRTEGVLRQHMFRDGRYWDTVVMGILRGDWRWPTVLDTP